MNYNEEGLYNHPNFDLEIMILILIIISGWTTNFLIISYFRPWILKFLQSLIEVSILHFQGQHAVAVLTGGQRSNCSPDSSPEDSNEWILGIRNLPSIGPLISSNLPITFDKN